MPDCRKKILREYIGNWLLSNLIVDLGMGYIVGSKEMYISDSSTLGRMPAGTTTKEQIRNYGGGIIGALSSTIATTIITVGPIAISRAIAERCMGYSEEESKRIANKLLALIAAAIYGATAYLSIELIVRDTDKLSSIEKEVLEYGAAICTAGGVCTYAAFLPKMKEFMRTHAPKWLNDCLCSPFGSSESEQLDVTHSINSQEESPNSRLLQPTADQPQYSERYGSMRLHS